LLIVGVARRAGAGPGETAPAALMFVFCSVIGLAGVAATISGLDASGTLGVPQTRIAGTGFGFGWVGLVIAEISWNQKDPERGPGVARERHAYAITMVGGKGERVTRHEFSQYHYAIFVLICQVENKFTETLDRNNV
jgi:hypothetical protein